MMPRWITAKEIKVGDTVAWANVAAPDDVRFYTCTQEPEEFETSFDETGIKLYGTVNSQKHGIVTYGKDANGVAWFWMSPDRKMLLIHRENI